MRKTQAEFLQEIIDLKKLNPELDIHFCTPDEILNFEFSGTVHMISSWVEQKIFSVKIEPFYQCSGKILTGEDEIREYFMDLFSDAIEHDEDLAPFIDDLYKKEVKPAICIYTLLQGRVND